MKGQTQPVTAVLITTITVGAIAAAYIWGTPLLEKQQSQAEMDGLERSIMQLEEDIVSVANSGQDASREVTIDVEDGNVEVNPERNYIDVVVSSSRASYPPGRWVLIEGSGMQNLSFSDGDYALKEHDSPGVVAVETHLGAEDSVLNYRVEFRNMYVETPSGPELELIDLQAVGGDSGTQEVDIRITNEGETRDSVNINGENLPRTKTQVSIDLR